MIILLCHRRTEALGTLELFVVICPYISGPIPLDFYNLCVAFVNCLLYCFYSSLPPPDVLCGSLRAPTNKIYELWCVNIKAHILTTSCLENIRFSCSTYHYDICYSGIERYLSNELVKMVGHKVLVYDVTSNE